jgi:precorrin-6Y C5,15-methyltransferase (decarboxylating)
MGTLYFIGVGMGGLSTLTYEGLAAVNNADLLIGAPRLLETFAELNTEKLPIINPDEINSAVRKNEGKKIALLFSGDIGFYSGADKLYKLLADYDIVTLPGISSLPYLAARLRLSWQDVHCISAHGRDADCAGAVQQNHKTFILTGGGTVF